MKLRPPRDEDFNQIVELLNASTRAAYGEDQYSAEEVRQWLTSPKVEPERDIRLAEDNGRLIGYVDVDPQGAAPVRWWSDVRVQPDVDADAVARALVRWDEERAGEGILRVWTPSAVEAMGAAYQRLGFRPVRHSYRMAIELAEEPQEPSWPEGLSVRVFEPGDERPVYDAVREAWLDTWEPYEEPYEEWAHFTTDRADFDPSLWFVAWDGNDVAGLSLCRVHPSGNPEHGFVTILAVRRPWRRQGLGTGLLRHSFAEMRRRGMTRASLGVDAENTTGAVRLYERAGMHVERRADAYRKQL